MANFVRPAQCPAPLIALSHVNLTAAPIDLATICMPGLAINETCCVPCPQMKTLWPHTWNVGVTFFAVEWFSFFAIALVGVSHFFVPYADSGTTPATVSQFWSVALLNSASLFYIGRDPVDTLCANAVSAATWHSNLRCAAQAFFLTVGIYASNWTTFARLLQLHLVCVWGWDPELFKQMGHRRTTMIIIVPWMAAIGLSLFWLFRGDYGMYAGDICFLEMHLATRYLTWFVFVPAMISGLMHLATMVKIYFIYREFDQRARLCDPAAKEEGYPVEADGDSDDGADDGGDALDERYQGTALGHPEADFEAERAAIPERVVKESPKGASAPEGQDAEQNSGCVLQSRFAQRGNADRSRDGHFSGPGGDVACAGQEEAKVLDAPADAQMQSQSTDSTEAPSGSPTSGQAGYVLKPETAVYATSRTKNDDRFGRLHRGQNPPPVWKMSIPERISAYMPEVDEEKAVQTDTPTLASELTSSSYASSSSTASPVLTGQVSAPEQLAEGPKIIVERVGGVTPRMRGRQNLDTLVEEEVKPLPPIETRNMCDDADSKSSPLRSHWSAEDNGLSPDPMDKEEKTPYGRRFSLNAMRGKLTRRSEDKNSVSQLSQTQTSDRARHMSGRISGVSSVADDDWREDNADHSSETRRQSQNSSDTVAGTHRSMNRTAAIRDMWQMNWRSAKMILTTQIIAIVFAIVFEIYKNNLDDLVRHPARMLSWFTCLVQRGSTYARTHGLNVWDAEVGDVATHQCESLALDQLINIWPMQVVALMRSCVGGAFIMEDFVRKRYWVALGATIQRGYGHFMRLFRRRAGTVEDIVEEEQSMQDERDETEDHETAAQQQRNA